MQALEYSFTSLWPIDPVFLHKAQLGFTNEQTTRSEDSKTFLRENFYNIQSMSDKKEFEERGVSAEEAEEIDLDEQAKPTRKTSHHAPPFLYDDEPGRGHKKKGTRKIK